MWEKAVRRNSGRAALFAGLVVGSVIDPSPAMAQRFQTGDVYIAATGTPPTGDLTCPVYLGPGGGIMRVDMSSGIATPLAHVYMEGDGHNLSYDPYRDWLLTRVRLDCCTFGLVGIDAAGTVHDAFGLHLLGLDPFLTAPVGTGDIYVWCGGPTQLQRIDKDGGIETVLDATGRAPFALCEGLKDLIYEPQTHALFTATNGHQSCLCPAPGVNNVICIHRLELSADGKAVTGMTSIHVDFPYEVAGFRNFDQGPDGKLVAFFGTQATPVPKPRAMLLDPVSMAISTYCEGTYLVDSGVYDPALNGVIVTSSGPNNLVLFDGATCQPTLLASCVSGYSQGSGSSMTMASIQPAEPSSTMVSLTVQLAGVNTAVSRCIRFQADDCASTDVLLNFDATGKFTGDIELPTGSYSSLSAKDRQHTLWATVPLALGGPGYTATATMNLQGGDTDDDGDVDIHDLTWLISQFGTGAASGGCPWDGTRDADFSGNGAVLSEDYAFQTANWLATSNGDCILASTWGPGERLERRSILRVHDAVSNAADVNGDGWIDHLDARLFEDANGLPHELSETMRATTPAIR